MLYCPSNEGYLRSKKGLVLSNLAVAIIAFLTCFFSYGQAKDKKILKFGFFTLPPHAHYDQNSKAQGPLVEFSREVFKEMGYELEIKRFPIVRLINSIKNGQLDGGLAFGKNEERQKIFVYPEMAFMNMKPAIVSLKSNKVKIKTLEDLEKLKNIGIYNKGFLSPMMRGDKVTKSRITQADVTRTGFEMVLAGRLQAFYTPDSEELKWRIQNLTGALNTKVLEIVYLPEDPLPLYTVFAKHLKHIVKDYDKILRSKKGKDTYISYLAKQTAN